MLYHVLGVVPSYQAAIGSALNELCLGLQPEEVAPVCASHFCFSYFCNVQSAVPVKLIHNL